MAGKTAGGDDKNKKKTRTHPTDDLVQEEKVQLAQDKQDGGENIKPDGLELVQDAENDIDHQCEIDDGGEGGPDVCEDKEADVVERVDGAGGTKDGGKGKGGVEGDVGDCDEEGEGEEGEWLGRRR